MRLLILRNSFALLLFFFPLLVPIHSVDAAAQLDFAEIDKFIASEMERDRIPGVALVIVYGTDIVYMQGYGTDGNGQSITPTTGFILGSMSKSFTALAIMQLVERDLLELDNPVVNYLPWFRTAGEAESAQITVRHLLNHTSGIPTNAPQAEGIDITLQDHVRALAAVSLHSIPGSKYEYASPNYLILGALVEEISGLSFAEYLQHNILDPLNMQNTFTNQAAALEQRLSKGHRYWFGFPVPSSLDYESDRLPTASVISCVQDLGYYLIAQLNSGTFQNQNILSPTKIAEMQRESVPADGFSYAMGWRVRPVHEVHAIHHGGILPHFRGKMVMLPEKKWGIAVLTNASTTFPLPIQPTSHRMTDTIAGYLVGQTLTHNPSTQSQVYWLITLGVFLVILKQLTDLIGIEKWRKKLVQRQPRQIYLELGIELTWPILMAVFVPRILEIPWSEITRGAPDMAWWLVTTIIFGVLTAGAKIATFLRNQSRQPRMNE